MSWEHREYAQSGGWRDPSPIGLNWPSGALRVIVIMQIVGWLLAIALRESIPGAGHYLNGVTAAAEPRPLAILLHPFTPWSGRFLGGVLLLVFSVWVSLSLGRLMQEAVGPRQMVWLFVLGNFLAGLAYFAMIPFSPVLSSAPLDWPAGGFAAWAFLGWRTQRFEFVPIGEKLHPLSRVIGIAVIVVAMLELVSWQLGAVNWLAATAFGGLAVFIAPMLESRWRWPRFRIRAARPAPRLIRLNRRADARESEAGAADEPRGALRNSEAHEFSDDERELDVLLAKISSSGLTSLSAEERDRLEALRRARLARR